MSRAPKRPVSTSIERDSKRTRFQESIVPDADQRGKARSEADERAFDEQILADLEDPSLSTRRNAVKTDGYESDSSDDGESVVRSRHAGANDAVEDDDMFAPTASTSGAGTGANGAPWSSKKKEEKFLALGDIEGQEFTGRGVGDEDLEDDEEDPDQFEDEDARERKAKEGMGYELSSFNMKVEMEEGKFAEDGTFHRTFDPHGIHDKWMDGIDDREMRKARKLKKKLEERERVRVQEEERVVKGKDQLYKELVSFLGKGETVLEALQRLGKEAKTKGKKANRDAPKRKGKGEAANALPSVSSRMEVDDIPSFPSAAPQNAAPSATLEVSPIDQITSLASTLMSLGNIDIYEETYESLLRTVRRAGIVASDWTPPPAIASDIRYEYRWAPEYVAGAGGQTSSTDTHGPYTKDELFAWRGALYFGGSGERIQLRRVGLGDWGGWDVIV
jgi:CD2 antigen cytoplasmic tail-binding protein 2